VSEAPASTFAILPAIDLRAGRVVRLERGDFAKERVFSDDPARVAAGFAEQGARWVHVVDLDGARDGGRRQGRAIRAIVDALATPSGSTSASIQLAGGLRDAAGIAGALDAGAARVVLGTVAITRPEVVADAIGRHGPERIAVALDVRGDLAVGEGWLPGAVGRPLDDLVARLGDAGVATLVVTAIARDGLLRGPDLELLGRVLDRTGAATIASGGIRSIGDLEAVRRIGCRGAIVGRALYDGGLDLASALDALGRAEP
jgi:phosphoribosylformimino-5-aminoimidazole carboxamide ribotide isomerase